MKNKVAFVTVASLCFILFGFVLLSGCEKEDTFDKGALIEYLQDLPTIATVMPAEKAASKINSEVDTTTEYIYHTDYYETAAGFDEQIVLNPQTDVIYPGALVKGESILDGTYTLIPAKRKPITISTSLTGGNVVSVVVDDPKLSTVREAVNSLMKQEYDVPYANMGFTVEQAYSESQLDLSLHASYKGFGLNVKGGFDFSNNNIKTRMVAKFIQSYYTLDMDLPNHPSDLFEDDVDRTLFGTYMPMYVSTVTYGRMALFTIESSLSETEVKSYLNASYAGVNASASAEFDELKANSSMKVYILGGAGGDAGATINGFEDFKNYIQAGENFSKTSPGAPISNKLRYIKDNSIGKIVFAASYPIVTALPRTDNLIYDIKTLLYYMYAASTDGAGGTLELYGEVYCYPKSLGISVAHDHFANGDFDEYSETYFSENTTTAKTWTGLKQTDAIMINIQMHEDDGTSDDHYGVTTTEIPVADIITAVVMGQNYDKEGMKVYNSTQYLQFTMRFSYT